MKKDPVITEEFECLHCSAACGSDVVMVDGNPFCCSGCAGVYAITQSAGYQGGDSCTTDASSQFSATQISRRTRFDFLEDESVIESLKEFEDDELIQIRLSIPNIHCTSCVWMLEQLNESFDGILESRVNFMKKDLTVTLRKDDISIRDLVELLTSMGYEPSLTLQNLSNEKKEKKDYRLLLKLGLAGFAFGNIMLFSFPSYLNGDETLVGIQYGLIFGILNIALSLPVLFYSASDYLKSAWAAILRKGINLDVPISIGIIALFTRSAYEVLSMTGEGYFDSFTGLIFFLLIGKWVQRKTFAQLSFDNDYKSYLPISVLTIDEDGQESSLAIEQLEIGQEILVRNQELIPVDSILKSDHVLVDYSFLSGESEPVSLKKGDLIYAGGKIIGSKAHMLVYKEVDQSHLTELWQNEAFEMDKDTRVTTFADRISPYFTIVVLTVAIVSAAIWSFIDVSTAVSVFTAVLIIACPCALALSTPFTLNAVSNILGQNGIYLRNTQVVERLSKTDTIVFDKTGTITNARQAHIVYEGETLTERDKDLIKSICSYSSNPVSDKISSRLTDAKVIELHSFDESLNRGGCGSIDNEKVCIGTAEYFNDLGFELEQPEDFGTAIFVSINDEIKGYYLLENSIRNGVTNVLNGLKESFRTYLLSGDDQKHFELFRNYFKNAAELLFHKKPQDKLDFIRNLQHNGHHVCMVGDGINDAGALKQADFGIAVNDDINSFSPACDAIFEGESLSRLQTVFKFSEKAIQIIIASFVISLIYNITGLGFAVSGKLTPLVAAVLMPLSSVTIMIFTYTATTIAARKKGLMLWK